MNIVILISGYGSNLKAIIEHINTHQLPISISAVISNNACAYGLEIAKQNNIKTIVAPDQTKLKNKKLEKLKTIDYSLSLLEVIKPLKADYIILAGFMRILSKDFISHYPNRIINIHPSLLPKYPGLNTHQKALENHDQEHGCTIHIVTQELDAGPILAQSKCLISETDTIDTLKTKVQKLEHILYPKVIEQFLYLKK